MLLWKAKQTYSLTYWILGCERKRKQKRNFESVSGLGREARSLQAAGRNKNCKWQTFFFAFLLKFCVVMTTLGSTRIELCLKPWANQCACPMEMSSINYVSELCSCLEIYLSSRFVTIALWLRMTHFVPMLSQSVCCGWGVWCNPLSFEAFPFSN